MVSQKTASSPKPLTSRLLKHPAYPDLETTNPAVDTFTTSENSKPIALPFCVPREVGDLSSEFHILEYLPMQSTNTCIFWILLVANELINSILYAPQALFMIKVYLNDLYILYYILIVRGCENPKVLTLLLEVFPNKSYSGNDPLERIGFFELQI